MGKSRLPTHIELFSSGRARGGLSRDSIVLLEQIRTIDKQRLGERMGHLDEEAMARVDGAISVSFGLGGAAGEFVPAAGVEQSEAEKL